eukprot:SAG11_NODE_6854_length_1235_cov_1.529049_2_plen_252_part_01
MPNLRHVFRGIPPAAVAKVATDHAATKRLKLGAPCFGALSLAEFEALCAIGGAGAETELVKLALNNVASKPIGQSGSDQVITKWTKKPGDSTLWLWCYIKDSQTRRVVFKYTNSPPSLSRWSEDATNMENGWWRTPGWSAGNEEYEHRVFVDDVEVVAGLHAVPLDQAEEPPASGGSPPIPPPPAISGSGGTMSALDVAMIEAVVGSSVEATEVVGVEGAEVCLHYMGDPLAPQAMAEALEALAARKDPAVA